VEVTSGRWVLGCISGRGGPKDGRAGSEPMSRKTIRPRPLDLFRKLDVIRQTPTKEEDEENGAPSMPPMAFKKVRAFGSQNAIQVAF
jgi:hypothetical protein